SGAQDLDTVVVHVDDRATEGHPQGMEVYGVEREAAGPSDLREPWAVDIPASDSVQPKLARGGIQPDLVAGAGGGIDPPADPARVVVERAETELHGQGVVAPPRLAPVRLGVIPAIVGVDSTDHRPAGGTAERRDGPAVC